MNKTVRKMALGCSAIIAFVPLAYSDEVDLSIHGQLVSNGSIINVPVTLNMSYDSDANTNNIITDMYAEYDLDISTDLEITLTVGNSTYYPDLNNAADGKANIKISKPDNNFTLSITSALREAKNGDYINNVNISIPLKDDAPLSLPTDSTVFRDFGNSSVFSITGDELQANVDVDGVIDFDIYSCFSQSRYEISGTIEKIHEDMSVSMVPLTALMTMTPRKMDMALGNYEDHGISSGFSIEIDGVEYNRLRDGARSLPALNLVDYGYDLSIKSDGLYNSDISNDELTAELIVSGKGGEKTGSIVDHGVPIKESKYDIYMYVTQNGAIKSVDISKFERISGCDITTSIELSGDQYIFEDVFADNTRNGSVRRVVIPTAGGVVSANVAFESNIYTNKNIGAILELEMPTGLIIPIVQDNEVQLSLGSIESVTIPIVIKQEWPNGIYQVRVNTLGSDNLDAGKNVAYIRKGDPI